MQQNRRSKNNFPSKSLVDSIKSTIFAPTRTRQASSQCLNRRVVLFLYDEQQNPIPEHHPSDAPQPHDGQLDYTAYRCPPHLLQSLHHQVFPQHHFAQQRHEGEGRCSARRLPVHRHHCHGLPSRMEERAFVAITAVS